MRLLDAFLAGFRWWRRARGGKWERLAASCACPFESWRRVPLFRARFWPTVIAREDFR